jgi:glycosyltransferase involved in cell wall biosynthesis
MSLPPQVREVHDLDVGSVAAPVPAPGVAEALAAGLPSADVYHATAVGWASALAAAAARRRGAGFVLTEHGVSAKEVRLGSGVLEIGRQAPDGIGGSSTRERWARLLEDEAVAAYAAASAITSVSADGARWQRALGAQEVLVLPHPPGPALGRTEAAAGTVVGMVARVVPLKDVETFVRACGAVAVERPEARFVVVGPTPDGDYLARCSLLAAALGLQERLAFVGEDEVHRWYSQLSVLVLTSVSEARPFVLLEAMQHGVPVVATDVGDCAEMLTGGPKAPAGLVVGVQAADEVAAAVLSILNDPVAAADYGGAGRHRIAAELTTEEHAKAYREVYERATRR